MGTSSWVTAIPVIPILTVTTFSPSDYMVRDGTYTSLLKLNLQHLGSSSARQIEFATLTVQFWSIISGSTQTMTGTTANTLFNTVYLYADSNNDGTFTLSDIDLGSITFGQNGTLSDNGTIAITLIDGHGSASVGGQGSQIYFLVIKTEDDASRWGTKTFAVSLATTITTRIEDAELDIPIEWSLSAGTSSHVAAVPLDPTVLVYDIIDDTPYSPINGTYTVKDASSTAILRIDIIHEGIGTAGSITLKSLRVYFGSTTTQKLNTTQLAEILGTISLFLDNGNDIWELTDIRATYTNSLNLDSSGIGTLNLASNNEIGGAGSKTYFVVVDMKPDASTYTKKFLGSISATADTSYPYTDPYPNIIDTIASVTLRLSGTSTGSSSTQLNIIPVNPTITVSDYVPQAPGTYTWAGNTYLRDGSETSLLKIDIKHNGTTTAQLIEFGSISVWFSSGTTQLSAGSMTGLFEYVAVYRDSLLIGSTTSFSNGTQTFNLYGSTTDTNWIAGLQTGNFFLKVKLKPSASGSVTRTFKAILVGTTGCTIRDAVSKIILEQVGSTGSESTKITAIPVNPILTISNSAPADYMVRDAATATLLTFNLHHKGSETAERVEFATLTATFYEMTPAGLGTTTMGSTAANNLFDTIYLYAGGNIELGSITFGQNGTLSDNGTLSITLIEHGSATVKGQGTETYFLVVKMKNNASRNGTKTFATSVNTTLATRIEDAELDIPIEWSLSAGTSSQTTAVPVDPTVLVYNVATSSYIYQGSLTVKDEATGTAILKMVVTHEGIGTAGSITLKSLRCFFGTLTTQFLSGTELQKIFESIYLYVETYTLTANRVATITNAQIPSFFSGGIATFTPTASNEIGGAGSKTYFVVVDMRPDASTYTKKFIGSISATADTSYPYTDPYPNIIDTIASVTLRLSGTSTGSSSTQLNIIPVNPTATITDSVGTLSFTLTQGNYCLKDTQQGDLLKMTIRHNGTLTAIPIEFSTLTCFFEGTKTTVGSLTNGPSLFRYIRLWRDIGGGTWSTQDTNIATITPSANTGTQTFTILGGNQIQGGTSAVFFLTVELTGTASSQGTRTFRAIINGTENVILRDVTSKIIL